MAACSTTATGRGEATTRRQPWPSGVLTAGSPAGGSASTAPTGLLGAANAGSASSTSIGRRRSSLRPRMASSFLVETTAPMTRARNMAEEVKSESEGVGGSR